MSELLVIQSLCPSASPPSALRGMPRTFSPLIERVVDEVERAVVARMHRLLPLRQPLHEMDLPLVLPRPRAFPRPSAAGEGHVPSLVPRVPQCCVVVLQNDLGEDAVATLPVFLHGGRQIRGLQLRVLLA